MVEGGALLALRPHDFFRVEIAAMLWPDRGLVSAVLRLPEALSSLRATTSPVRCHYSVRAQCDVIGATLDPPAVAGGRDAAGAQLRPAALGRDRP